MRMLRCIDDFLLTLPGFLLNIRPHDKQMLRHCQWRKRHEGSHEEPARGLRPGWVLIARLRGDVDDRDRQQWRHDPDVEAHG